MKKKLLLVILFIWIILSCLNVLYNTTKVFSEIREWGVLTRSEKEQKVYGDAHLFATMIAMNTEYDATILLYSPEGMNFYYGRYSLYPRLLTWVTNERELRSLLQTANYPYVATSESIEISGYEQIADFSSTISRNKGMLYRKK